jgi:hypothetical protein
MRTLTPIRGLLGVMALLAASSAAATVLTVTFAELQNPPSFLESAEFPQPPLPLGTATFAIPAGERVVGATVSGFWGSSVVPDSTAGVDVLVDGILVARCVKHQPDCYEPGYAPRPWTYTFTRSELRQFDDGAATMTAVQTSDDTVRLGQATLVIETARIPTVPALSPLGLLWLTAGLAAAGALALRRMSRA